MKLQKKHLLPTRWFHWLNFLLLGVMIWSGTLIYWANDVYKITIGGRTLFSFYPDSIYELLNIPFHLAEGMAYHFVFMWFFAVNGFLYFFYLLISGEFRHLLPTKQSLRNAIQVTLYDLHLRKEKPEQGKYNDAQKIAYSAVIFMGLGSIVTGLAIYKPVQFSWITSILGGYQSARMEHFYLNIGFMLFFLIHLLQVIRAGWNNFRAMVAGFVVMKDKKEPNNNSTAIKK